MAKARSLRGIRSHRRLAGECSSERWLERGCAVDGGRISYFKATAMGFSAYDAASGERLWQFNTGLGIIGAPISYSVAGRQYISILVGYGGATAIWSQLMPRGWKYGAQPRRLLTFSLAGKAALPPTAARSDSLNALDDPALEINDADARAGQAIFNLACSGCHGLNLNSPGSPARICASLGLLSARKESGPSCTMARCWQKECRSTRRSGREKVLEIYAYIRAGAREALGRLARPARWSLQAATP